MAEAKISLATAAQKALDDLNSRSIYTVRSTLVPVNTPVMLDSLNALATETRLRLGEHLDMLDLNKLSLTPKQLAISYHGSIEMNELSKKVIPDVPEDELVENVSLQTWIHRVFGNAAGQGMDLHTATGQIWSQANSWSDSKKAFVCHILQAVAFYRDCVHWTNRSVFFENLILVVINTQLDHVWLDDVANDGLAYFNDISLAQWYFVVDGIVNNKSESDSTRVSRPALPATDMAKISYGLFKPPRGLGVMPYRKSIPKTVGRTLEPVTMDDRMTAGPEPNLNDDAAIMLSRARQFLRTCIYNLPKLELECDHLPKPSGGHEAHSLLESEIKDYKTQLKEHITKSQDAFDERSVRLEKKGAKLLRNAAKVQQDLNHLSDESGKLLQSIEEIVQEMEGLDSDSAEYQVRAMIFAQIEEPVEQLMEHFNPNDGSLKLGQQENAMDKLDQFIERQKDFYEEFRAFETLCSETRTHLRVFKKWYKLGTDTAVGTDPEDNEDD